MNISEALTSLGVTENTLTSDEKAFLDREGYLPLRGVLSGEQVREPKYIKKPEQTAFPT